jgi:hypothetical protein
MKTLNCMVCNSILKTGEKATQVEGVGYSLFICLACAKLLSTHAQTITEEEIEEYGEESVDYE